MNSPGQYAVEDEKSILFDQVFDEPEEISFNNDYENIQTFAKRQTQNNTSLSNKYQTQNHHTSSLIPGIQSLDIKKNKHKKSSQQNRRQHGREDIVVGTSKVSLNQNASQYETTFLECYTGVQQFEENLE